MIGCTSMERHIVPSSMKSPLERLAGKPQWPQFIDVSPSFIGEIDTRCEWLYVNITDESLLSEDVWNSIEYQLREHAHVILYVLDFKLDPGFRYHKGYQELALYSLRNIEMGTPTYVSFDEEMMIVSTYSLRPVVTNGA